MNAVLPGRRWWGGALLACCATVLAALAVPVHLPEGDARSDPADIPPPGDAVDAAPEDLRSFLVNRRWGDSLQDLLDAAAAQPEPEEPLVNPVLAKMGFVGLIVTGDRSAVLLELPQGAVARVVPGQKLPDGHTLVSVTDNSLTLEGDNQHEEVLTLFPRVRAEPPPGDGPPADGATVPPDSG